MRQIVFATVIVLAAFSIGRSEERRNAAPSGDAEAITVQMSNFAFSPAQLRLKAGVPVRLRLVNESSGGHDFSAPGFFAASSIPSDSPAPANGAVAVGSHKTVEVVVVPRTPGTYRFECTHFLHGFFGMHGTITVSGQQIGTS